MKLLSRHLCEGPRRTAKVFSQGWNSNLTSPEYKPKALEPYQKGKVKLSLYLIM
jgi:hypothetical protein